VLRASVIEGGCPVDMACANILLTDPLLGSLGNHGGKTETFSLQADSPAIDAAELVNCPGTGQRGIKRPQNLFCDAGAFEARFYALVVNKSGIGGVSGTGIFCGPTCDKGYPELSRVTLTAEPGPDSYFTGWSGACSGTGACHVIMSTPREVTANFEPIPPGNHTLAVNLAGNGSGTVTGDGINCHIGDGATCSKVYSQGTEVTLTANPGPASNFTGWSGACSGKGQCIVTMSEAKTVTAAFNAAGNELYMPMIMK
jgi:hypothetical protein